MTRWLILLGGPLIWAAHFNLIYAINSISIQAARESTATARGLIVGSGVLAVLGCLYVLRRARKLPKHDEFDHFWRLVAATGAVLGAISIVWQSLPALAPI